MARHAPLPKVKAIAAALAARHKANGSERGVSGAHYDSFKLGAATVPRAAA